MHEITQENLAPFNDPDRPLPTETFSKEATLRMGGDKLELAYKGADHCSGNIFINAPKQKVLAQIDIVPPGAVTFMHCDAAAATTTIAISAAGRLFASARRPAAVIKGARLSFGRADRKKGTCLDS